MNLARKIAIMASGAVLVLGTAGAAFAAPAVATGSVNVRSGPSTQYQRLDTLQRNQLVEVTGCRSGWCYVEKRGADGWVSANYLRQVAVQNKRSSKPAISFSFNFGNTPAVQAPRHHDRHWGPGRGNGGNHHYNDNRNNNGFSFSFGN